MCLQTSNLAAQATAFTRVIHSHNIPKATEARTRDTTNKTNDKVTVETTSNYNVTVSRVS